MEKMNITGALRKVARLKGEISEIDSNLKQCSCYEEGKESSYSFKELYEQRVRATSEMIALKVRLAKGNCETFEYAGRTTTGVEAVRSLEELRGQIALLTSLPFRDRVRDVERARETEWDDVREKNVSRTTERVIVSAMTRAERDKTISELRRRHDELNLALETFNHTTLV